jgi:endonuclease YncB( thermonuclease family)
MDIDKYRRLVCIVYLNGRVINQEMIAEGLAWAYRKYLSAPHSSEYIRLEDQARSTHMGLWQQNNPQPPWEFRKMIKSLNN